jgi:hypothetical protein
VQLPDGSTAFVAIISDPDLDNGLAVDGSHALYSFTYCVLQASVGRPVDCDTAPFNWPVAVEELIEQPPPVALGSPCSLFHAPHTFLFCAVESGYGGGMGGGGEGFCVCVERRLCEI